MGGRAADHGPGVAFQMHLALSGGAAAHSAAVRGDAPQEPLSVPQLFLTDGLHALHQHLIAFRVRLPAEIAGRIQEMLRCPDQQEGHHGAFPAAQVEAVVPVRPQAAGHAVCAYMSIGKVQRPLHVPPYGGLTLVGVGDHPVEEAHIAAFPHVFHNGRDQPQRVVGAGVLQAVDHAALLRRGHHRGRLEGRRLPRLEPGGVEQVQAIARGHLPVEQLFNACAAHVRLSLGDAHGVLRRVAVSQPRAPAHLDKGGKTGKQHVHLALVQVPDVQTAVHVFVGRAHLQGREATVPPRFQFGKGGVRSCCVIAPAGILHGLSPACAQVEQYALLLTGLQGQALVQRAAGVASQLQRAGQNALLHPKGIALGAVGADEGIPHAVKAVGLEISREELPAVLFVMGLHQHRPVFRMGAGGVQAHLEVLVVHVNMVEGEFHIAEHAHLPGPVRRIADAHIENFDGVAAVLLPGDEQRLPGGKLLIVAGEGGIAQPVAAFIARPVQGKPRGLPAHRPEFTVFVVPQVDVVPGKVEGHAVGPEAGDAVVLGRI